MDNQVTAATTHPRQRFDSLTSMRFIAASCIVTMHLGGHFCVPGDMTLAGRVPLFQGVSFFFVLSGFILTYVYPSLDTSHERRRFFVARMARVWPGHVFATIFWACIMLSAAGRGGIGKTVPLLSNLLMVHAWIPMQKFYGSGNAVSWSVSTEVGFYLLFPLLVASLRRTWLWKVAASLALAVMLMVAGSILDLPYTSPRGITTNGLLYMNPLGRLFEFVCGMAAAVIWRQYGRKWDMNIWMATLAESAAILLVLACAWFSKPWESMIGSWVHAPARVTLWLTCGGLMAIPFAILIVLLASGRGVFSRMLSARAMIILGEISYSIYLVHFPLLLLFDFKSSKLDMLPIYQLFLFVGSLLTISFLVWSLVETPARKWMVARFSRKPATVAVCTIDSAPA